MTKDKKPKIWTVRNKQGQLIGRYWGVSAKGAIVACLDADAVQGAQFRSYTRLQFSDLVAAVEG